MGSESTGAVAAGLPETDHDVGVGVGCQSSAVRGQGGVQGDPREERQWFRVRSVRSRPAYGGPPVYHLLLSKDDWCVTDRSRTAQE